MDHGLLWHESFLSPVVKRILLCIVLFAAAAVRGELLPGFSLAPIAKTSGFCSGVATDSNGVLYYTTTSGDLFRLDGATSTRVAHVNTIAIGNGGLLGLALPDDRTAIVHYTRGSVVSDVISRIDLTTGGETLVHEFIGDVEQPGNIVPSEHHGGNPIVTADGTIYVGIGDYGSAQIAALPQWNAGKIWRIDPNGNATQVASGFRNPFDLAFDPETQRLIVPDNGELQDDEINVVTMAGGFFGWPYTSGNRPPYPGAMPPAYVFPTIVAPTGFLRLTGRSPLLRSGYLLGTFVTKAVEYIPNVDAQPFPAPIAITSKDVSSIVDITESPNGDIVIATGLMLYRLTPPRPGDCNGDGLVTFADLTALDLELADGDSHPSYAAQDGSYRGSWGCDANADGVISRADMNALWRLVLPKSYAVRHR